MLGLITGWFDYNKKQLVRIEKLVAVINSLEEKAQKLADSDFPKETDKLKKSISKGTTTLDEVLPWAFALTREASARVLGLRHYDEQLIAGIVLHEGNIAEQKTGEGKTLSASAPLYLNALAGRGTHLVTVNDYLARRDAGWMGEVYTFLGLSVASIISDASFVFDPLYTDEQTTDWRLAHLRPISRSDAYKADVTYGINSEFGFDYLRDNMARSQGRIVQRDFYFAIIDEVDSVLIDEARTPHIISAPYEQDVSRYYEYAKVVQTLGDGDYVIDEKLRTSHITEQGIERIEKTLGVDNIYEKDYETLFHIEAALKAHSLFKKDKDYIVRDGEVIIVDEFTGRLLEGRRYSEGLHQAIEAKERVAIKQESRTLATVSLQNYFRMYEKLAGMTGTAQTEAEEFSKIYKLDVVVIPTHQKAIRNDHPDYIYKNESGKFKALIQAISEIHETGRPILIGTSSIEKNEEISRHLKKRGIRHELLNAKNHEREAHIIAQAGMRGAVTVATNMAGRGVDIVLGGEPPNMFSLGRNPTAKDKAAYDKIRKEWQQQHDDIVALGGLYVISTDRHESRRIDNQLRGRAGRQGDPGDTRFFVSLEDDLMRIFGGEQVARVMAFFNMPEDQPVEHAMVSRALEQAQQKVEGFNFDTRKSLVEYDDVLNKQREIIYKLRRTVLIADSDTRALYDELHNAYAQYIQSLMAVHMYAHEQPDIEGMAKELDVIFPEAASDIEKKLMGAAGSEEVEAVLQEMFVRRMEAREKAIGKSVWYDAVKFLYLDTIDTYWTEHLTAIDDLRSGINLRGYAQLDPLTEYKHEAFNMFESLISNIRFELLRRVSQVQLSEDAQREMAAQAQRKQRVVLSAASGESNISAGSAKKESSKVEAKEPVRSSSTAYATGKIGRNDPCWCGSGKKYKKCHLPTDSQAR